MLLLDSNGNNKRSGIGIDLLAMMKTLETLEVIEKLA